MLIEFTVGNYRSFKDPVTFSLVATDLVAKDKSLDESNVFQGPGELKLLKSAAVYGANGSGKSNLVEALRFMLDFMVDSSRATQSTDEIGVEPFRLSTLTEQQPSSFELVCSVNGVLYRYGFKATRERVVSEWLYNTVKRESRLFYREESDISVSTVFGGRAVRKFTRDNALFLSVAAQFNIPIAELLLLWIRSRVAIISGLDDDLYKAYTIDALLHNRYRQEVLDLIRSLDLNIEGIDVEEIDLKSEMFPEEWPEDLKEATIRFNQGKAGVFRFLHKKFSEAEAVVDTLEAFDPEEESEGTRKLFALSGLLIHALKTSTLLVIDEFDARLHPLISRKIIELFNSQSTNPGGAQLVCATHDTNLLSNKLFRRDQIWFTEKTRLGATDLYSLAEYKVGSESKVRNDASFASDYIKGRYGAIPFVSNQSFVLESHG